MWTSEIDVLIVEDNPGDARLIVEMLNESRSLKFNCRICDNLSDAVSSLTDSNPDIIILDLNLPDSNGLSTLATIYKKTKGIIPLLVLTGINDEQIGLDSIKNGAEDYLVKGEVKSSHITRSIRYAIERKKMLLDLKAGEEQYQELMNNANSVIIRWRVDGTIVYINEYALKLFGYKAEEIIGRHVNIIVPEQETTGGDLSTLVKNIVADPGSHASVLNENICKDGSRVWMIWTNKPVYNDSEVVEILAIGSDISELKNTKDALSESEERYRVFMNSTDDMAFLKDEKFRYIMTNKNHTLHIGKKVEEIIGKTDFEILPYDTALQCEESDINTIFQNTMIVNDETRDDRIFESRKFPVNLKGDKVGIGSFIRDVTALRKAAASIEKASREWRTTFDSIEDVIWLLDPEFKILRANIASEKMFGISPAELIGKNCWNVVHGTDLPIEKCPVLKAKKTLKPENSVIKIDDRWVNITVFPIIGEDKNLTGVVHTIKDITQQKQTEDNLILRSVAIENAANGIIITDLSGVILWANQAFENLTGYSLTEVVGLNPRELIKSGKHDSEFYRKMWETIASGKIWSGEITNRRKDGTLYVEEMTIAPVKNSIDEIINFIAIKQDITDKKFAIDLLNARLELVNYSNDHSVEEILIKTLDEVEKFTGSLISFFHFLKEDQTTLSLQAWSSQTSQKFCEAVGKGMHYNIDEAGVWVDCIHEKKAVVHNDYMSLHHRRGLPDGHAPVLREMVIPIIRNNVIKAILGVGNKTTDYIEKDISVTEYFANIAWDIIERKKNLEYLEEFNRELELKVTERTVQFEKANKELESFSYSVSHDLRSPLRHITGFLEMLRMETGAILSEKAEHYINVIDESAKRMGQLIDDLLSFSRMSRTSLSNQNVDLRSLVYEVLADYSEEIQSGKIVIKGKPLPDVKGDRAMLRVVYVNLISNAIKFSSKTENPEIEIGYKSVEGEDVYYVRDNGAGFNMKYADKLFGVFQRLHNNRDFDGTGIGLAMVKSIIERHNGRIWAESEPGKGACFYFTLPENKNEGSILGQDNIL